MPRPRRRALRAPPPAGLLCAVLALLGAASPGARAADAPTTPESPDFRALLIGCTEYPKLRARLDPATYLLRVRLRGSANDVAQWESSLRARGVPAEKIVSLAGWSEDRPDTRPTRANIVAAFDRLEAAEYRPGDRVLVAFSGHGEQVKDDDGDELDGLDEAWLPADADCEGRGNYTGVLRDDEIGERLRRIRDRGALVWLVMDCCHSATGMRAAGGGDGDAMMRTIDPSVFGSAEAAPTRRGTRGLGADAMSGPRESLEGIVAFYAAQSDQRVPEVRVPRGAPSAESFGLLTSSLLRGLSRAGADLSFGELYAEVVAAYVDFGESGIVQPLAEGDLALKVFSAGRVEGPRLEVRRVAGSRLEVNAGSLFGLVPETELSVYRAGRRGDPSALLGTVTVSSVTPVTAACRPVGPEAAWARGAEAVWPAEVSKCVVGDLRVAVAVVAGDGKPTAAEALPPRVKSVLSTPENQARFPLALDAAGADWLLLLDAQGAPRDLVPARQGVGGQRFAVTGDTLEATLHRIRRAENLLRVAARSGPAASASSVRLEGFETAPGGVERPLRPGSRLCPGTQVRFRLHNLARATRLRAQDVHVFWLDPHYGVSMLFPFQDASGVVGPRLTSEEDAPIDLPAEVLSDESLGTERLIVFTVPKRPDAPHLDLSFLAQDPLQASRSAGTRGMAEEPVAELLEDVAYGGTASRSPLRRVDAGATPFRMSMLPWETSWGALHVPAADPASPAAKIDAPQPAAGAAGDRVPDAWALGPAEAGLAQAHGAWCLLVTRGPEHEQVFVDLDGAVPESERTPKGLAALAKGRVGAEIALRIAQGKATVWYDRDRDGRFDLVLADGDGDGWAEERWLSTGTAWPHEAGLRIPVLSTAYLSGLDDRDARLVALVRLSALTGR